MFAALNLEKEPTNATINNKSNSSASQSVLCTACCFGLTKNQPKPPKSNTNYSISQNNPFLEENNESDVYEIQDVSNKSKPKTSTSLSFPNSRSVAYSPESPSTTSCPTMRHSALKITQKVLFYVYIIIAQNNFKLRYVKWFAPKCCPFRRENSNL